MLIQLNLLILPRNLTKKTSFPVKKLYFALLVVMAFCIGCQWNVRVPEEDKGAGNLVIERFDRVESVYLTMADYAALSQMRTDYPQETRMLIEDVLKLGAVNDVDINNRFLVFFQDSTLQAIIEEVSRQYSDLDDVESQLDNAFDRLMRLMPALEKPRVYTQIGSLDQSIVVGDGLLGISLDKYLGADHPIYIRYGYTEQQRNTMTREYIVPDCLSFYLLSLYPLSPEDELSAERRYWHISKIQCLVNEVLGRRHFSDETIDRLEQYRRQHRSMPAGDFLQLDSI